MRDKSKNTVKAISLIIVITLVGKILGLLRDIMLAGNYATGMEASAFMTASRIPRVFFDAIFASAISSSFIPIFNEYLENKGKKEAFDLSSNFISIVGVFTLIMTVLGIAFSMPLTHLFADGFDAETASLCSQLLKFLFPTVFFTGIAFSFVGILQSLDDFIAPAAMSIVSNGIIIVYFLFLNDRFGIYGLTAAFLLGWAAQGLIQIPSLIKKGYRYKFKIDLKDSGIKKIFILMASVMVSTWIQPINLLINTKFASRLYSGSAVSAIEYANSLYTIIVGVFVLSVANVIFPELSRLSTHNDEAKFKDTIKSTLKVMFYLLIPMMIGLMIVSTPLVRLLYERNEFGAFSTAITSKALFFFAIGMIGYGLQVILSRAYYAVQDGKTPLITGIVSIALNYIMCVMLIDKMEIGGLALASAASQTVSAIILIFPINKKMGNMFDADFLKDFIKILVSAGVMAVIAVFARDFVLNGMADTLISRVLAVALPAGVGVFAYLAATIVLKTEETGIVLGYAKGFLNKFRGGEKNA